MEENLYINVCFFMYIYNVYIYFYFFLGGGGVNLLQNLLCESCFYLIYLPDLESKLRWVCRDKLLVLGL